MTKLRDICRFQSGGTPSRGTPAYFNGNVPWITTVALNGDVIDGNQAIEWITGEAIAKSAAKIVPPHSVMVGTRVGIGKVAINSVPMSTSQDIISLIGIDENKWDKKFICHLITANKEHLTSQARGATIKGIKIEAIADLVLPEISLTEQARISEVIGKVDALMHMHQQMAMNLEQLIKSRFIELFGDCDLTHPQESWVTIKEIGSVVGGATPKTDHDEYWGGSYRWITPAELDADSGYIYDSVRKLTKAGVESCSLQEMPVGTVILSSRAPIGKVAIAGNTFYCNQGFKNIICKEGITPRYLYTVLLLNVEYLNSLGRGATFKEISKGIVESIRIPVPSMELQEQFAAFVEQTDKSKLAVQKGLQELEILKKSLMQQYFG